MLFLLWKDIFEEHRKIIFVGFLICNVNHGLKQPVVWIVKRNSIDIKENNSAK